MRFNTAAAVLVALLTTASAAEAQAPGLLDRLGQLDVERVETDRAAILYSVHDLRGTAGGEAAVRVAQPLCAAADYFAKQLDGDFRFTLALLSPRDWGRTGGPLHPIPWHSQRDRLVVLPVRPDLSLMIGGRDSIRSRQVQEVVSLHQLGHVVTAAFYQPGGFRAPDPPVRWFDELLASYLSYTYMREHDPELAEFMTDLAWQITRSTEPRFSSLEQYDALHDAYLSAPQGSDNLGWYHNAFNLRAEELYKRHGPELMHALRSELPWDRIESWTTEELLELLEPISPGFVAWAEEMASATRRRY